MKRKIARIGPSGAALVTVVGSVVLSLLILAPPRAGLLPPTALAGPGHVEAVLLPRPHVSRPHVSRPPVHQLGSASATAAASIGQPSSQSHASPPAHHLHSTAAAAKPTTNRATIPAAVATTPTSTTPTSTTPAAASHLPASGHHGKPAWAADPHGSSGSAAADPAHPVHPSHPAHPAHPDHSAKGGKA
jgi:hypothetical protein